ncbi:MAG: YggT family protein [Candidatus Aminicenantaceae bacterium]
MILLGNFLSALAKILHIVLIVYMWIIIIRAIFSWINVPSLYPLVVILHHLTEPVLRPFRRIIPPYKLGGIDLTPLIVILIILFVDSFIVKSLAHYAQQLLRESRFYF